MMCPVCKRDLAPTLSICLTCGAMIHDTVREELETKISRVTETVAAKSGRLSAPQKPAIPEPVKQVFSEPVKQVFSEPVKQIVSEPVKHVATATAKPIVSGAPTPQISETSAQITPTLPPPRMDAAPKQAPLPPKPMAT